MDGTRLFYSEFSNSQATGHLVTCLAWMVGSRLLFELVRADQRPPDLERYGWRWPWLNSHQSASTLRGFLESFEVARAG